MDKSFAPSVKRKCTPDALTTRNTMKLLLKAKLNLIHGGMIIDNERGSWNVTDTSSGSTDNGRGWDSPGPNPAPSGSAGNAGTVNPAGCINGNNPSAVVCGLNAAPAADSGGGGGGKVICTELCRNGVIEHNAYSRKHFSEQTMRGYHAWGVPYVKLMRKSPLFAKLAEYPTQAFAQDIAYRMGVAAKPNYMGWALRELAFRPVCWSIGVFAKARDFQHLWTGKTAMA
jgi:hypothetical protein